MPSISSDARFLGVDLQSLWREIRKPWLRMHQWPILSWLTPTPPIRLLHADGGESVWLGTIRQSRPIPSKQIRFNAVQLPEDRVLRRRFTMPAMGEADTAKAVELEVRSISPFAATDLAWGETSRLSNGMREVEVALVSRKQIEQCLGMQAARLQGASAPEVWAYAGQGAPIIMHGYGEGLREAYATRWRQVGYGLLLLAACLLAAIAITPTVQLWMRATEAVASYEATVLRTRPLVSQREKLLQSAEKLKALSESVGGRIEPLRVLERLTRVLPDDTALQNVKIDGATVTITGLTANASTLMQLLSDQPGLREVRAPSAATRIAGSAKESFVIVFSADPQQFGVVGGPPPGLAAPLPVAAPTATTSASGGASATATAVVPSAAAASAARPAGVPGATTAPTPPPAPAGGAVFGGGATFGGTRTRPASAPAAPASAPAAASKP